MQKDRARDLENKFIASIWCCACAGSIFPKNLRRSSCGSTTIQKVVSVASRYSTYRKLSSHHTERVKKFLQLGVVLLFGLLHEPSRIHALPEQQPRALDLIAEKGLLERRREEYLSER
jgi:hypothetical protein